MLVRFLATLQTPPPHQISPTRLSLIQHRKGDRRTHNAVIMKATSRHTLTSFILSKVLKLHHELIIGIAKLMIFNEQGKAIAEGIKYNDYWDRYWDYMAEE